MSWIASLFVFFAVTLSAAPVAEGPVVYVYDSFTGKGSLGEAIAARMAKKYGVTPRYVTFASAGEALNQIALDHGARADVVVGIDAGLLTRARAMGSFAVLEPELFAGIPDELRPDAANVFLPFDYGFLAFVYDKRRPSPPPAKITLDSFARDPAFRKRVALTDPRTSSLGLSFLLGTAQTYPEPAAFEAFWRALAQQVRATPPGWSGAYGLFLKKEVDFVLSYTTSPAYHREKEKSDAYAAVQFPDGAYRQVESAGMVRNAPHPALGRKFLELLVSPEVQAEVPTRQWMYPARAKVALPASFKALPPPPKAIELRAPPDEKARHALIERWLKVSVP